MEERKKIYTVTEQVNELLYDICNKSHLIGSTLEFGEKKNYKEVSNIKISQDEEIDYQIKRSLTRAFATLESDLSEYLYSDKEESTNTVEAGIDYPRELTFKFVLPANYDNASLESLAKNIHSYLVETALAEWFTLTCKEEAEVHIANSSIYLLNIKRALYKRMRPMRPFY